MNQVAEMDLMDDDLQNMISDCSISTHSTRSSTKRLDTMGKDSTKNDSAPTTLQIDIPPNKIMLSPISPAPVNVPRELQSTSRVYAGAVGPATTEDKRTRCQQ